MNRRLVWSQGHIQGVRLEALNPQRFLLIELSQAINSDDGDCDDDDDDDDC